MIVVKYPNGPPSQGDMKGNKANGLELADCLVKRDQQTSWALTDEG